MIVVYLRYAVHTRLSASHANLFLPQCKPQEITPPEYQQRHLPFFLFVFYHVFIHSYNALSDRLQCK